MHHHIFQAFLGQFEGEKKKPNKHEVETRSIYLEVMSRVINYNNKPTWINKIRLLKSIAFLSSFENNTLYISMFFDSDIKVSDFQLTFVKKEKSNIQIESR